MGSFDLELDSFRSGKNSVSVISRLSSPPFYSPEHTLFLHPPTQAPAVWRLGLLGSASYFQLNSPVSIPFEFLFFLGRFPQLSLTIFPSTSSFIAVCCAQPCPTLCNTADRSPSRPCLHGDSPGKNTGAGCPAPSGGPPDPGLLDCRSQVHF